MRSRRPPRPPKVDTQSDLHPNNFPLGSLQSRAAARFLLAPRKRIILLFSDCEEQNPHVPPQPPLNLAESSCDRMLSPHGVEITTVILTGRESEISEDALDAWILSHPIRE